MVSVYVQAVLLDLDGTLVDSSDISRQWWLRWVGQVGLDWGASEPIITGRPPIDVMRTLLPSRPERLHKADIASLERWEDERVDQMRATEGSRTLLDQLPAARWAVVTTSRRPQARARLQAAGLPEPRVLISADEVCHLKPDPEGYMKASLQFGVSPTACLVIEDSAPGVRAGHAAGATVVAVGRAVSDANSNANFYLGGLYQITVTDSSAWLEIRIDPSS